MYWIITIVQLTGVFLQGRPLRQKTWGQFSRSEFSNHIKQWSLLPFALYWVHFVLLVCVFIYTYCCATLMSCKMNLVTFKSNIFVIWCVYVLSGRKYMQFLLFFLSLLILEIQYHGWDPIDWYSPATYPCLSQTRPLISIGICSVLLFD